MAVASSAPAAVEHRLGPGCRAPKLLGLRVRDFSERQEMLKIGCWLLL